MQYYNRQMLDLYTDKYSKISYDHNQIDNNLYGQYGVKRGLRDKNGQGVLVGITNVSLIQSSEEIDGKSVPCDGKLFYRGYNILDLVKGFVNDRRFGYEEITYLLLFGVLPTRAGRISGDSGCVQVCAQEFCSRRNYESAQP